LKIEEGGTTKMPALKINHLFISHAWDYKDAYERFCNLLDEADNFDYKNHSIPKDDKVHTNGTDKELYEAIIRKISGTNIVIIMAGVYSTYRKWIKKEIKVAQNEFASPKPILGVKPWANTLVSDQVRKSADELVGWNTSSIVEAIRRLSI
jgi:hypothetical protein